MELINVKKIISEFVLFETDPYNKIPFDDLGDNIFNDNSVYHCTTHGLDIFRYLVLLFDPRQGDLSGIIFGLAVRKKLLGQDISETAIKSKLLWNWKKPHIFRYYPLLVNPDYDAIKKFQEYSIGKDKSNYIMGGNFLGSINIYGTEHLSISANISCNLNKEYTNSILAIRKFSTIQQLKTYKNWLEI